MVRGVLAYRVAMRTRVVAAIVAVVLCAACTANPAGAGSSAGTAPALASGSGTPSAAAGSPEGLSRTGTSDPGSAGASGAASGSTATATTTTRGSTTGATATHPDPLTPWPTYHGDVLRTGGAAASAAPSGTLRATTVTLDGQVYASPIVAGDLVIVATEGNGVYGLDPTGHIRWHVSLGAPTPRSGLPCGNIDPIGITGTPHYDRDTDTVYLVTSTGPTADHTLVALDPADGRVRWRRSVDLPGVDHTAMQQRGALTVTGGRVWVPFGGLAGDCGDYLGRVVGVPVGGGAPVVYTVPTGREGGIWTPPGPTVYHGDLLVAVGNGESTGGAYDHSDAVLRLRGTTLVDSFSPTTWASDNASDLDLGSQGAAVVQDRWVFQAGKSGTAYVLRADHLGGIGGQVSKTQLCASYGGTAVDGDVVYVPCTDGVAAVRIAGDGHLSVLWRAASTVTGSPVYAGNRVYAMDPGGGRLAVLDAATGATLQSVPVGVASRFATPAISGGRLYVGTLTGLAVVGG